MKDAENSISIVQIYKIFYQCATMNCILEKIPNQFDGHQIYFLYKYFQKSACMYVMAFQNDINGENIASLKIKTEIVFVRQRDSS